MTNIYRKLIEVRKAVPSITKNSRGSRFRFVSSSQILGALRQAMDAHGLLLIPRLVSERVLEHQTKRGDRLYFTILNIEFTWVNADNPDERIACPWVGQGLDEGERGVGKALTYAEKYFLLKFFNIPTDGDDPDADDKRPPAKKREASGTAAEKKAEAVNHAAAAAAGSAPPGGSAGPTQAETGGDGASQTSPEKSADAGATAGQEKTAAKASAAGNRNRGSGTMLVAGSPMHKKIEAMIREAGIDRALFKEWLLAVRWLGRKHGKPSFATMLRKNAKSLIENWTSAREAFGLWADPGSGGET
jgi:hypothetical protein